MESEKFMSNRVDKALLEELIITPVVKEICLLDISKVKPETYLPKIREIVNVLDRMLCTAGQELCTGKPNTVEIGEYIVKKTESDEDYHLMLTHFLDYVPGEPDSVFLKEPGVRITYNGKTKDIMRIDKLIKNEKGRLLMGHIFKK